jgi:spore maturation protein CgeB
MKDFDKLRKQMRADWDRRVSHDYRFWMSDGFESDEHMWRAGERDFSQLFPYREELPKKARAFELGCGVGRLLRPAARIFDEVIGIDISGEAVEKARKFLCDFSNVKIIHGNGTDLHEIEQGAIDVVFSYAALTSCPTSVIASYLVEFHRILRPGGLMRLQLYLGDEQRVNEYDTLHLRCYSQAAFLTALERAGFEVDWVRDLNLPFQVSFEELGINAVILAAHSVERESESAEILARCLLPSGHESEKEESLIPDLEAFMAAQFAEQLARSGDHLRAEKALRHALAVAKTTAFDTSDMLARIVETVRRLAQEGGNEEKYSEPQGAAKPPASLDSTDSTRIRSRNEAILKELRGGKEALRACSEMGLVPSPDIELKRTDEGEILLYRKQCLDHPSKPVSAARGWAERAISSQEARQAETFFVLGLGSGYHLKELIQQSSARVIVVEPHLEVLAAVLSLESTSDWLGRLAGIYVGQDGDEFKGIWGGEFENAHFLIRPQSQVHAVEFCRKAKSAIFFEKSFKKLSPSIVVLGPIQGGTLPIAHYTLRGLLSIGQRARLLDMSSFAGGYGAIENIVQDELKQILLRNRMVQFLSDTLLETYEEKPFDILLCMAQAPVTPKVLNELRGRGVVTILWFMEDYLRFTYWQQFASSYDFIFCIQKGECIDALKGAGVGEVHYLPVGCDPTIHRPVSLTDEEKKRWGSPVSFVGAGYHNRQQSFASLSHLPFKIWGTEWPEGKPFDKLVQEKGRRLTPEEYMKIFQASDINLNLHSSTEKDGVDPSGDFVNPRTFELAAAGAFQLCDHRSLLPDLFEPDREIIIYRSIAELKEKIEFYSSNKAEREMVVRRGQQRALKEHTYAHRLRDMLALVYSSKYSEISARMEKRPWKRFLSRAKSHTELHERCMKAYRRGEEPTLDALVSDIIVGDGDMTETEQKLMFLFHVRKQTIKHRGEGD